MRFGRSKKLVRALAAVAVAALLAAVVAQAATRQLADDQEQIGVLDIASLTASQTRDGMYRHVVQTYESWQPEILVADSGPPPSLCLLIWTSRTAGKTHPNYQLCASATSDGRKLRGTLSRIGTNGAIGRAVRVDVDRPDDRSAALEVTSRQIGRPKTYRVAAVTQTFGDDCPKLAGCEDFAPPRGKAIRITP